MQRVPTASVLNPDGSELWSGSLLNFARSNGREVLSDVIAQFRQSLERHGRHEPALVGGGAAPEFTILDLSDLTPIRDDLWAVLASAPKEAVALRQALIDGKVDGSTYSGECACLVGTIANARHCDVNDIPGLAPNASRPIERFFMGIKPGDTPDKNEVAKLALAWTDEWLFRMREAFGPKVAP